MPKPVTVWAVELGRESPQDDVKGVLMLKDDALAFAPVDERIGEVRIPLATIEKVRRLRGSPVLMVIHGTPENRRRTAFYFVQPPPLGVLLGQSTTERPGIQAFRNPKRKARRDNVGYLGVTNRQKKSVLTEWVRDLRAALAP